MTPEESCGYCKGTASKAVICRERRGISIRPRCELCLAAFLENWRHTKGFIGIFTLAEAIAMEVHST